MEVGACLQSGRAVPFVYSVSLSLREKESVWNDVKLPSVWNDVKLPSVWKDVKLPSVRNDVKLPTVRQDIKLPTICVDEKHHILGNEVSV